MSILTTFATVTAAILVVGYGIGQITSKSISTHIEIDAPAETVWNILCDGVDIASWNPFVKRMQGALTVGNQIAITVQPEGKSAMDFKPFVLVADKGRELRWVGRLGFKGVFDGEHYFLLEQTDQGTTIFRHGETFSGMLVHILFPLLAKDTTKGFEAMNKALKARAEAAA